LASTAWSSAASMPASALPRHRLHVDAARRVACRAERRGAGDRLDDLLMLSRRELAALQRLQGGVGHRLAQRLALLGARLGETS
jgi:hypothetical protein